MSAKPKLVYRSSPIKRERRTQAEITALRTELYLLLYVEHPMTVRQCFHQAESRGLIAKTEAEYKTTITRLLTNMRLSGVIPFDWIAENTRWMRKPHTRIRRWKRR